ncbi:hypothetical protein JCM8795_08030 [Hydrogenobaculum acidophilum]
MPEHICPAEDDEAVVVDVGLEVVEEEDGVEDDVEGVVAADCSDDEDDDSLDCWWLHATRPSAKTAAPKSVFFILKTS